MSLDSTKADEIALALEEAIVSGGLAPGAVLRQEQVSAQYEVSRTPVREALRRLAALGLVSFVPTAASASGRSRARRCGRRSCSGPSSRPRHRGCGGADHRGGPRGARGGRAALLTPDQGAPGARARRRPAVDHGRVDAGQPRLPRRDLPDRRPALIEQVAKSARRTFSGPAVWAPGDASIDSLYRERAPARGDPWRARPGSPEGARALAREHVLASFRLLETILEQVGGTWPQPKRATAKVSS